MAGHGSSDDDKIGHDIKKAAEIIKNGGVVVYPTETVYGIGASIFSEIALNRIFEIKKRERGKPISVAVSGLKMMDELVYTGEKEIAFIKKFLPGPVTVLMKKKSIVPDILTPGTDLVGIRYPDNREALMLIELAGVPITSTSANFSGDEPPKSVDEIKIGVDYILYGGTGSGEPSTVVDIPNLRVVRRGARFEEVLAALCEFEQKV